MLQNKGRIALFIDGNNLFHIAQQLNIEIDYTKLLKYISGASSNTFIKAYFYGINDTNNEKQQGFYTWLKYNGYKVITKSHTYQDKKNSLDLEIAVDIIKYSSQYDTAIIIAGSNELHYATQYISSNKGLRVEYIGMKNNINNLLQDTVDLLIDIYDIKTYIEKSNIGNFEKYNQFINNNYNNNYNHNIKN